ncbi:MAG: fructosamine kinase family protein [Kouleothrix sp.]|nr:fructosamine kinase family protein [Kouleothrix sp.]
MTSEAIVEEALRLAGDDTAPIERAAVGGGSISRAERIRTARGEYLLKTGGAGLQRFFECEARGLGLLAASGAVRVPGVLAYRDADNDERRTLNAESDIREHSSLIAHRSSFILLEWLAPPAGADRARAGEILGTALAALHRSTAPAYGLDHDNYIGATPQPNGWAGSWLEFFRERRLRFQADLARRQGRWTPQRERLMERLLGRLDRWIDGRAVQPSLLHGDLWGGNFIVGPGGAPALIDPAAYYGDREADLAFTALFGGFPEAFYQAYAAAWPLPAGWRERQDLYNLYHLLNHLNLFGEGYGSQVDQVLRRYAG